MALALLPFDVAVSIALGAGRARVASTCLTLHIVHSYGTLAKRAAPRRTGTAPGPEVRTLTDVGPD